MSLQGLKLPTYDLTIGSAVVVLRPLTLSDVAVVLRPHLRQLAETLNRCAPLLAADAQDVAPFAAALICECGPFVAAVISQSAGEPDALDIAARLPAAIQIEAITAILRMTMAENQPQELMAEFTAAVSPVADTLKQTRH